MQLRWLAPVALCVLAAASACGSDDDNGGSGGSGGGTTGGSGGTGGATGGAGGATGGTAGSGGSSGSSGSSGSAGTGGMEAGAPVKVSGTVFEFQQAIPEGGAALTLADVKVCESGTTNCATTDVNGQYSLMLASNLESVLLFTKATYANTAIAGLVPATDFTANATMPTEIIASLFTAAAKFTWPLAGNGVIIAFTNEVTTVDGGDGATSSSGLAGSTLSLTPIAGKGPVYVNASQFPDPAETSTTAPGWGAFGDLPPGTYTVKAANTGRTCTGTGIGNWPSTAAESVRVPVIADFITNSVTFNCN